MPILILLAALLASGAAGCALPRGAAPSYPPEAFSHRATDGHVALYWNCSRTAGILRVEGVAQNPWEAQPIRYLEFELVGLDARDRTVSRVAGAARDSQILTNQTTPFRLELNPAGGERRFDLYYEYRFLEGENMGARLAGRPATSPRLLAQGNRSVVRDACGEGKHPAR